MATTPPPGPPPVTGIDLTQFAEIVNNARTDDERALTTPLVATAGDGTPDLAYRGSTMVWDKDNLAWWERTAGVPMSAFGWRLRLVEGVDLRHRLHEVRTPALVVIAPNDRVVPPPAGP